MRLSLIFLFVSVFAFATPGKYSLFTSLSERQAVDVGSASNLNFDHDDTFHCTGWDFPTDANLDGNAVGKIQNGPPYQGWLVNRSMLDSAVSGSHYQFYMINDASSHELMASSPANTAPANRWTNWALSYNGGGHASDATFWINGARQTTVVNVDTLDGNSIQTSSHVFLGGSISYMYFSGFKTQYECGPGELSDADALEIYNAGTPQNKNQFGSASATSYWPLQNTFQDKSSGGNDGVAVGSPFFQSCFYPTSRFGCGVSN